MKIGILTKWWVINSFINTGLHIHCPDGSTSKDGPSAGAAITCAIYSLFVNSQLLVVTIITIFTVVTIIVTRERK